MFAKVYFPVLFWLFLFTPVEDIQWTAYGYGIRYNAKEY